MMVVYDTRTHEILTEVLAELKKINKHNAVYVENSLPAVDMRLIGDVAGQSKGFN